MLDEGAWFEQLLVAEIALIEDVDVARKAASVVASYVERREELDDLLKQELAQKAGLDPDELTRLERILQAHDAPDEDAGGPPALEERPATEQGGPSPGVARSGWPQETGPLGTSRYQELTRIGSGSMGEVYRARDVRLDRVVAIKVLRRGGSDVARDRFVAEARVAARIHHPAIIPIYELGVTPNGYPYYVMPHVGGGRTLLDAIHECATTRERLQLLEPFVDVCDAIQHAHAAGFVHCDIKPANIALERLGEPIVLDWGLARGEPVVNARVPASISGTPGYMAPEACGMARGRITYRSDVYGLGATLFQLLTGERPPDVTAKNATESLTLALERAKATTPEPLLELCAQAMAWDPARRSLRASEIADRIRAWQRGDEVARERTLLHRQVLRSLDDAAALRGERAVARLDHALAVIGQIRELEPESALPDRLQQECVDARRAALAQQTHRVRRRTRRRAGAWVLVAAGLAGVVMVFFLKHERGVASDARMRTQVEITRANNLAGFLAASLQQGLEEHGNLRLQDQSLRRALAYFREREVGDATGAATRQVVDILRQLASVTLNLGDIEECLRTLEQARTIAAGPAFRPPVGGTDAEHLRLRVLEDLSDAQRRAGLLEASLRTSRQVLEACRVGDPNADAVRAGTLTRIGMVLIRQGKTAEGLEQHQSAVDRWRMLREDRDDVALDIRVAVAEAKAGRAHFTAGELPRAEEYLASARSGLQQLSKSQPLSTAALWYVANATFVLGLTEYEYGRLPTALSDLIRAWDILEKMHARDPHNTTWRMQLAHIHMRLWDVHSEAGRFDDARTSLRTSLDLVDALARSTTRNRFVRDTLRIKLIREGEWFTLQGKPTEALAALRQSAALAATMVEAEPSDVMMRSELGLTHYKIARALFALNRVDEARSEFQASADIQEKILESTPQDASYTERYLWSLLQVGKVHMRRGRTKSALAAYARALELAPALVDLTPEGAPGRRLAGLLHRATGEISMRTQPTTARAAYEKALPVWDELIEVHPNHWRWHQHRAYLRSLIARTHARQDRVRLAALEYRKARDDHAKAVKLRPDLAAHQVKYANETERYELYAELREPDNPMDEYFLGRFHVETVRADHRRAIEHFKKALESETLRRDFAHGVLFQAACAAAHAVSEKGGEDGDRYVKLTLRWLREDVLLRRERIKEIKAEIADPKTSEEARQRLQREIKYHEKHIQEARSSRFEFEDLRGMKEFEEVFQ